MENRKDFMYLFSLGKGDLWNRQKNRQWTKNSVHISKKIGRTTYNVAIHFSKTSRETMTDKINRLILHDINSEDFS